MRKTACYLECFCPFRLDLAHIFPNNSPLIGVYIVAISTDHSCIIKRDLLV